MIGKIWRSMILLLGIVIVACTQETSKSESTSSAADGPLRVPVSNYPLKYFAERIAGNEAKIIFLAPADEDPAFWEPTADDIRAIQQADIILFNGADYEKWAPTVTLPASKIVNTSAAFSDQYLTLPVAVTHSHGPEGEHSHEGTDFNTWLDPLQAIQQAQAIRDALAKQRPASASEFSTNYQKLESDLQALHQKLEAATADLKETPLVASHPVYGYFARRYGLQLKAVLWEPEVMPSEEQWAELKKLLADHPARTMIWEGEPDPAIQARLDELGVAGCVVPPAGNTQEDGDYLAVWNANAERIAAIQP